MVPRGKEDTSATEQKTFAEAIISLLVKIKFNKFNGLVNCYIKKKKRGIFESKPACFCHSFELWSVSIAEVLAPYNCVKPA